MGTLWISYVKFCQPTSQSPSHQHGPKTLQGTNLVIHTTRSKNCLGKLSFLLHSTPTTQTEILGRESEHSESEICSAL